MLKEIGKTVGLISIGALGTYTYSLKSIAKLETFQNESKLKLESQERSINVRDNNGLLQSSIEFVEAIHQSRKVLSQWKTANCIPGYVVGVSLRGQSIWVEGGGYSDIENATLCHPKTVMRIASISKSMTAAFLAKMIQLNQIELDKSIHDYLSTEQFPVKQWQGQNVDITLRQLVSHLGGIRHYKNDSNKQEFEDEKYLNKRFANVIDSLSLFKDDPLVCRPGSKLVYTTYGWTLISAVMETQTKEKNFSKSFTKFLHQDLGLNETFLDENDPIIYHRSRYYMTDTKTGKIRNVPYVDSSYKWAGGGLLSSIPDLLKFGNMMLYSFKGNDRYGRPGFLDQTLVEKMWTPAPNTDFYFKSYKNCSGFGYGIGWAVIRDVSNLRAFTAEPFFSTVISHTGSAIGASSVLLIEPELELVVAIIMNTQTISGISSMATEIAKNFALQLPKADSKSLNFKVAL